MPDQIARYAEEALVALGTIIGAIALFWTRFAGLFPARKTDVAEMKKSVDRLHERFDELKDSLHDVREKQARIEGACSAIRQIDRGPGRPAE